LQALTVASFIAGAISQPTYAVTITSLIVPGDFGQNPDHFSPTGINNSGQVVGSQIVDLGGPTGFIFSGKNITNIGCGISCDGLNTGSINKQGQVITTTVTCCDGRTYVDLYSNGSYTNIETPVSGDSSAFVLAVGLSDNGTALILQRDPYLYHTYLYKNGTITDISNAAFTLAGSAISPDGKVAGTYTTTTNANHLFVYVNGAVTDLGPAGGANTSVDVKAINNAGQIAGNNFVAAGTQAFLYSSGAVTPLGTLGGATSEALGLNALGDVVGNSATSSGGSDPFLYADGKMTDLNSVLPANSGWNLQTATAINDLGEIVGQGTFDGQKSGYLLDLGSPIPEPASWSLLAVGIGIFWLRRNKRLN